MALTQDGAGGRAAQEKHQPQALPFCCRTYSKVKYGEHVETGEAVAVKVLDKEHLIRTGGEGAFLWRVLWGLEDFSSWCVLSARVSFGICSRGLSSPGILGAVRSGCLEGVLALFSSARLISGSLLWHSGLVCRWLRAGR